MNLAELLLQVNGNGDGGGFNFFSILWIVFLFVMIFFGERIRLTQSLLRIESFLRTIAVRKDNAKKELILELQKEGMVENKEEVDRLLEYFTIRPVGLDPAGIIEKMDHLYSLQRKRIREEIEDFIPKAEKAKRFNIENILEIATSLNLIFKITRHFYLLAKKGKSIYLAIQVETMLSSLKEIVDALQDAIGAFKEGKPVGDSIGPLTVSGLMTEDRLPVVLDTVYSETRDAEGRKLVFVKAEGPGGTVGRIGDAVESLAEKFHPQAIVMIDAALKFEGETTGEVAEGIGAAIGGLGIEKYKIEEIATKNKIPLYAIIVKMSFAEAIGPMDSVKPLKPGQTPSPKIRDSVPEVCRRLERLIAKKTKPNDTILIVGVGNTIGIK